MFAILAKSGLAKYWPVQPRHIVPGLHEVRLSNSTYSNDNLPGLRRPKGQRRIPSSALTCHWLNRNGRLEGCWHPVTDDTPSSWLDEHPHCLPGRVCGRSPLRSRNLALAG
jgi:hypothetical protein